MCSVQSAQGVGAPARRARAYSQGAGRCTHDTHGKNLHAGRPSKLNVRAQVSESMPEEVRVQEHALAALWELINFDTTVG